MHQFCICRIRMEKQAKNKSFKLSFFWFWSGECLERFGEWRLIRYGIEEKNKIVWACGYLVRSA